MEGDRTRKAAAIKRPESGSSIISSITNPNLHGALSMAATSIHNAMDRERIDRLLNCFTLVQK